MYIWLKMKFFKQLSTENFKLLAPFYAKQFFFLSYHFYPIFFYHNPLSLYIHNPWKRV